MQSESDIDPDNPPTRPSDWIGAEVLGPGERGRQRSGPTTFFVYRASDDPDAFVITDRDSHGALPPCPSGAWKLFKTLPETGKKRVGFSEAEAKRQIAARGFHRVEIRVDTPEAAE